MRSSTEVMFYCDALTQKNVKINGIQYTVSGQVPVMPHIHALVPYINIHVPFLSFHNALSLNNLRII